MQPSSICRSTLPFVFTGYYQIVSNSAEQDTFLAFRRETENDRKNDFIVRHREVAKFTPNVQVEIKIFQGAIKRRADTAEKQAKVLDALRLRQPAVNPTNVADVPLGWITLHFPQPMVPTSHPYGECPQAAIYALLMGALDLQGDWYDSATSIFYSAYPQFPRHKAADTSTWWGVNAMSVFVQLVGKRIGRPLQLTKARSMMQRYADTGQLHRQLLLCESVLLVRATLTDDMHWFVVDGSRKVWYALDDNCTVILVHPNDHVTEASAINFFENTMQVDVLHNAYSISIKQ